MNEIDPHKRTGRHMLLVAWVIALGLLAFFFGGILDKQHNPNQAVQTSITKNGDREVVLTRNRQGHYVTRGSINGEEVVFLLDTGATVVAIPEVLAQRLRLQKGPVALTNTANGVIETYSTRLDQVGIGDLHLSNIAAQINPHDDGDEILLGMSFLKRLEMIQRGDTLTLRLPAAR